MRIPEAQAAIAALLLTLLAVTSAAPAVPSLTRTWRSFDFDQREDGVLVRTRRAAEPAEEDAVEDYAAAGNEGEDAVDAVDALAGRQRAQKQLPFFPPYYPPPQFAASAYPPPQYYDYGGYQEADDNEVLSRTEPGEGGSNGVRKRPGSGSRFPDSPVYYIRMPPSPYMFVPGLGYVSQPPPPPPAFSPFINVPVDFVANGKPTSVYQWRPPPAQRPQRPPPPPPAARPPTDHNDDESPVTQLDQGPYVFNGRPTELFLLRNTYNSLYNDALQNIYP